MAILFPSLILSLLCAGLFICFAGHYPRAGRGRLSAMLLLMLVATLLTITAKSVRAQTCGSEGSEPV